MESVLAEYQKTQIVFVFTIIFYDGYPESRLWLSACVLAFLLFLVQFFGEEVGL